jgi:hypothetical protein
MLNFTACKKFVFKLFVPTLIALAIEGLCIPQHISNPHGMMRTDDTIPLARTAKRYFVSERRLRDFVGKLAMTAKVMLFCRI